MKSLFVLILLVFSVTSFAELSQRQQNLVKRGIQFDGWQDEGLLKVSTAAQLQKHQRMSANELHKIIETRIAKEKDCMARNVANESSKAENCFGEMELPHQ